MTDSSAKYGTVYLVGAGPGHPGLITRWGFDLLQKCDAVAYDALIPMELISGLHDGVEKYYVGKRSGKHSMPQSQINELLVSLARRGLNVVRLKGGDPFVFGRIGEEAEYVAAAGIPIVMVPGVTAASAAAAMSGFSLTSRQESSWIFIATGHPAENSSTPVPWDRVASLAGGTLVIYMGIARLEKIVGQLIDSGMAAETPAVVVQAASTGLQKSVLAPLGKISDECHRQGLKPPALVIIGESVRCRVRNSGTAKGALAGIQALLTGPSWSTESLAARLREAGAQPIPYPTVSCRRFNDVRGWGKFCEHVHSDTLLFFPSEIGVRFFYDALMLQNLDLRSLAPFKIIARGGSIAHALLERGLRAEAVIEDARPGALRDCLAAMFREGASSLIYILESPEVPIPEDCVSGQHGEVIPLVVGTESTAEWDPRWKDGVLAEPPDFIVFTGATEVKGFIELMGVDGARELALRSYLVAIGESTLNAIQLYGLPCNISLKAQAVANLVEALSECPGLKK
jgi:uroporphyrinogen III methyltransferase/synthase